MFEPCVLVRTEARQMAIVSPGRVRYESIFEVFQDNDDQEEATVTFFTKSAERRAGFNEWMQGHADRQEVEGFLSPSPAMSEGGSTVRSSAGARTIRDQR